MREEVRCTGAGPSLGTLGNPNATMGNHRVEEEPLSRRAGDTGCEARTSSLQSTSRSASTPETAVLSTDQCRYQREEQYPTQ